MPDSGLVNEFLWKLKWLSFQGRPTVRVSGIYGALVQRGAKFLFNSGKSIPFLLYVWHILNVPFYMFQVLNSPCGSAAMGQIAQQPLPTSTNRPRPIAVSSIWRGTARSKFAAPTRKHSWIRCYAIRPLRYERLLYVWIGIFMSHLGYGLEA